MDAMRYKFRAVQAQNAGLPEVAKLLLASSYAEQVRAANHAFTEWLFNETNERKIRQ